jgi:acyl-CoA reductase-like NAD-dependent aldehyde dehydrogenase
MEQFGQFINGRWTDFTTEQSFLSRAPASGEVLAAFSKGTPSDVKAAVDAAEAAFPGWRSYPAPKRGEILLRAAHILRERKEELGRLVSQEMGKAIAEGRGDVQEAIDFFEYVAGEGRRLFGETTTSELQNKFAMTVRQPIGVVGCITPWNFPIAIPAWKLGAALIAGNTVIFKPASQTPLCATRLVQVLEEAEIPAGVLNLVVGSSI